MSKVPQNLIPFWRLESKLIDPSKKQLKPSSDYLQNFFPSWSERQCPDLRTGPIEEWNAVAYYFYYYYYGMVVGWYCTHQPSSSIYPNEFPLLLLVLIMNLYLNLRSTFYIKCISSFIPFSTFYLWGSPKRDSHLNISNNNNHNKSNATTTPKHTDEHATCRFCEIFAEAVQLFSLVFPFIPHIAIAFGGDGIFYFAFMYASKILWEDMCSNDLAALLCLVYRVDVNERNWFYINSQTNWSRAFNKVIFSKIFQIVYLISISKLYNRQKKLVQKFGKISLMNTSKSTLLYTNADFFGCFQTKCWTVKALTSSNQHSVSHQFYRVTFYSLHQFVWTRFCYNRAM